VSAALVGDEGGRHLVTHAYLKEDGSGYDYLNLDLAHAGVDADCPMCPIEVVATVEGGLVVFDAVPEWLKWAVPLALATIVFSVVAYAVGQLFSFEVSL